MKIAFVSDAYVPVPSGVAVSMETLRLGLERLGHTVYIFAVRYPGYRDVNRRVVRLPAFFSRQEKYRPTVWPVLTSINKDKIKHLGIDIVHSHYYFDFFDLAPRLAKTVGAPLV